MSSRNASSLECGVTVTQKQMTRLREMLDVLLKSPQRKTLSLPIDAVIRDGKGATVWIKTANNTFKSLMVQTGLESDDRIEIKSGLTAGDVVVISGAYLLQSEYIFKKGVNPMSGHDMSNM